MKKLGFIFVVCFLFSSVFAFAPTQNNNFSRNSVLLNTERIYWEPSFSGAESVAVRNADSFLAKFAAEVIPACRIDGVEYKTIMEANSGNVNHYRMAQYVNGLELYGSDIVVSVKNGNVIEVNGSVYTDATVSRAPVNTITDDEALKYAMIAINFEKARTGFSPVSKKVMVSEGSELIEAYLVRIASALPLGDYELIIDAKNGNVLHTENMIQTITGSGSAYKTHPLLENPSTVSLPNITKDGYLSGSYCKVENEDTSNAYNADNKFFYDPDDTHFDEVNVYYLVNFIHDYYKGTYGYTGLDKAISCTVHQGTNYDNAYYSPWQGGLFFGDGNKLNDLAKEETVIWHEYTHAVTGNIVYMQYSAESGAMNEAFSDFIPCSISNDPKIGEWAVAKMNRPYMRTGENTKVYPADIQNEVHRDGEIYFGVLWDLRKAIGASVSETLAHKCRYYLFRNATFADGLAATLRVDKEEFNGKYAEKIKKVFKARGIEEKVEAAKAEWERNITEAQMAAKLAK